MNMSKNIPLLKRPYRSCVGLMVFNKIGQVFCGQRLDNKAEAWQLLLSNQKLLKCSHPASAAYRGGIWDSNDVFKKANDELEKQNKTLISW